MCHATRYYHQRQKLSNSTHRVYKGHPKDFRITLLDAIFGISFQLGGLRPPHTVYSEPDVGLRNCKCHGHMFFFCIVVLTLTAVLIKSIAATSIYITDKSANYFCD